MPRLTVHADEAAWLAHRRRRLTSSDCCTLLGLGYGDSNAFSLWYEKVHGESGFDPDRRRRFEAGHHFESLMAKWAEEDIGEPLYDLGDYAIVEHDGGILSCTTDRVLADGAKLSEPSDERGVLGALKAIVSFKTTDRSAVRGYQESKAFGYAMAQAHVEMMCCEVEEGWIVTMFGLMDAFTLIPILRNDHLCEVIGEAAERFWSYVQAEEVPPPEYIDESKAIGDALAMIYAGETGEVKVLDDSWGERILRLDEIRKKAKALEGERQKILNLAARALEGASFGIVPGCPRKLKWAKRSGGGFFMKKWEQWGVSDVLNG